MIDGVIKGTGTSRYVKGPPNAGTLWPTYEEFIAALAAGEVTIDLAGINPSGWTTQGTKLNKANLLKDTTAALYGLGVGAVPDDIFQKLVPTPGAVFWYTAEIAPLGYLICDGATVARTDYPLLYNAIGTTFGGNSTNFKLPDLRAMFIRGAGTQDQFTAQFARKASPTYLGKTAYSTGNGSVPTSPTNYDASYSNASNNKIFYGSAIKYTGALDNYAFRPVNIALTPIIKY